jgi:Rrf2 family protein
MGRVLSNSDCIVAARCWDFSLPNLSPPPKLWSVKLSVKSDYAVRAVLGLAARFEQGVAVRADDIAAEHGIPVNYLVQILIELKSKQIVKSQRGKEGGYLLARPPAEITFGDILRAFYGSILDSPALSDPHCAMEIREAWRRLGTAFEEAADAITFQQLLDARPDKEKMYYI